MLTYLRRLQAERDSLTQAATQLTETAATENRDVTDAERASITSMSERCASIDDQLRTFNAQLESQRAYAELRQALEPADDESRTPPTRAELAPRENHEPSWGRLFVESAEFRAYNGRGSSTPIHVPGLFERAAISITDGFGLPPVPYTANIPQPSFTTPLLDAVGHITTNSNLIQWLVDDGVYPPAAVVPEGQPKPEADITVDMNTGTLQTYAHWKGITRQALANIPMIRSIVENQLRGGIATKLEADLVAALGAAVINEVPTDPAAGGMLGAIRVGIANVQLQGFPNANSVVLNPTDWAALDLAVFDSTNNGPTRQSGFWGLNPIPSPAVPAGTAYVGDLKIGATVFDEGTASVYMSDSHSDYFVRNTLVVLAEIMALAMVTQPAALARVTPFVGP
jgi:HK97 family phage major capsid protein